MKKLLLSLIAGIILSPLFGQDFNQIIMDTAINKEIMFGYCNREGFTNELFSEWFNTEYDAYVVDEKILSKLDFENNPQPEITIVYGTWCEDSQREVPRFYKILDKLGYNEDNLTVIAVNRKKSSGEIPSEHLNIELVPTIIIFENGMEKGRIIESPKKSLEKDLVSILTIE